MMVFGNKSLSLHLHRGLTGLGFVYLSIHLIGRPYGWTAFLLMPAALWLLKGCPVCWTVGLFETIAHRIIAWNAKHPASGV